MTAVALVLFVLLVLAILLCVYLVVSGQRLLRFIRRVTVEPHTSPPAGGPAYDSESALLVSGLVRQMEKASAAALEERDRLKATADASSSGIVAVSHDGSVSFFNAAARELLRPSAIADGVPLARAIRDHEIIAAVERSRAEQRRSSVTVEYGPDRRQLQVDTEPLQPGSGWSALLVFHDLSDVRRIERTRREFVSNVSHELRTPLASVRAAVETLEDGALEDDAAARSFLASIRNEVDRMTLMVEELLELSKIESGAMPLDLHSTDMAGVVEAAVARVLPQAERKALTLRTSLQPDLPSVVGDAGRLEQALVNLLQNAVRFTDDGGAVSVAVNADTDVLTVAVQDSGAGIGRSHLPHIFERFYKADPARSSEGVGLGLAIVKHIAQAHGGSVFVDSEIGRGSTFGFTLPVERD